jgi:hypothetical protein
MGGAQQEILQQMQEAIGSQEAVSEEMPQEAPESQQTGQEQEFSDVELQAMEQGWNPEGVEGES